MPLLVLEPGMLKDCGERTVLRRAFLAERTKERVTCDMEKGFLCGLAY
jgi:hypothetical protein